MIGNSRTLTCLLSLGVLSCSDKDEGLSETALPCYTNCQDLDVRGVHIGTNNAINFYWSQGFSQGDPLPADFADFLGRTNASFVGISVAISYYGPLDTEPGIIWASDVGATEDYQTFGYEDDVLQGLVDSLVAQDLLVYVTVALEPAHDDFSACYDLTKELTQERHRIGDIDGYDGLVDYCGNPVSQSDWWWDPAHPDHAANSQEWWENYTAAVQRVASFSQGANLISVGTETDRVFTTDWSTELSTLASAVRAVNGANVTYGQHYTVFEDGDQIYDIWHSGALGADVIGVSAWYPMYPTDVIGSNPEEDYYGPEDVSVYEGLWESIGEGQIAAMAAGYPQKPLVFVESGSVDSITAPVAPDENEFVPRSAVDTADDDGDGLPDGHQTQASILEGLLRARESNNDLVDGLFPWNNWIAWDEEWDPIAQSGHVISVRAWTDQAGVTHQASEDALSYAYGPSIWEGGAFP